MKDLTLRPFPINCRIYDVNATIYRLSVSPVLTGFPVTDKLDLRMKTSSTWSTSKSRSAK